MGENENTEWAGAPGYQGGVIGARRRAYDGETVTRRRICGLILRAAPDSTGAGKFGVPRRERPPVLHDAGRTRPRTGPDTE